MHFAELTAPEQRVLGCLIEKRWTTPDQYPLSLNALRLACNQSTNRDPVTDYDETDRPRGGHNGCPSTASPGWPAATRVAGDQVPPPGRGGARARPRAAGRALRAAAPRPADARRAEGPQRADGAARVRSTTSSACSAALVERGYARRIERRPGQKEDRFQQLLGGDDAATSRPSRRPPRRRCRRRRPPDPRSRPRRRRRRPRAPAPVPRPGPAARTAAPDPDLAARVAALEAEVARSCAGT